jgi:hypothetical protein
MMEMHAKNASAFAEAWKSWETGIKFLSSNKIGERS